MLPARRALISVSDKNGLEPFARGLATLGIEIVSTGGTLAFLRHNDIPALAVADVTGFPEILDGRVKTLHPRIHAGILASRTLPDHAAQLATHDIDRIDLVVVNLYPFRETAARPGATFDEVIEQIDVGGPAMVRAAAKNHGGVAVVVDPADYTRLLAALSASDGIVPEPLRRELALKAFRHTQTYDAAVADWLARQLPPAPAGATPDDAPAGTTPAVFPPHLTIDLTRTAELRYGENPHQSGAVYSITAMAAHRRNASSAPGAAAATAAAAAAAATEAATAADAARSRAADEGPVEGSTASAAAGASAASATTVSSITSAITTQRAGAAPEPAPPPDLTGALGGYRQLAGKELSWNNLLDADAARKMAALFTDPTVVIVKHNNPCGVGRGADLAAAYLRALATDPVSAFGSVIAVNSTVDGPLARAMTDLFVEVLIAPAFDDEALRHFAPKKNLRLLEAPLYDPAPSDIELRAIAGGFLAQAPDAFPDDPATWTVASRRPPTGEERRALQFAWSVSRYTKSNAIVITNADQTVGVGAGQMSRVDSCRIAVQKAQLPLAGTVAASDAYFPFRDGLDVLAAAGIIAVVQPGGSKRDPEVIAAADEANIAMLLTGTRHFRH